VSRRLERADPVGELVGGSIHHDGPAEPAFPGPVVGGAIGTSARVVARLIRLECLPAVPNPADFVSYGSAAFGGDGWPN